MGRRITTRYPYTGSTGKLKEFFNGKEDGTLLPMHERTIPQIIDTQYLSQLGFTTHEHGYVTRILKKLDLIDDDLIPTNNYRKYVGYTYDKHRRNFLTQLVKRIYIDLFIVRPDAWKRETHRLQPFFETAHRTNPVSQDAIRIMITTFRCLTILCSFQDEEPEITSIIRRLDSIPKTVDIQQGTAQREFANLTNDQEDQFLQSIACLDIEAYRASIVLAWTAVADYIRRYFEIDDFQQLRDLGGNLSSVTDVRDLLDGIFDKPMIDALKETYRAKVGSQIGPIYSKLDSLRIRRNSAAHPSDQEPERVEALAFIIECMTAIERLTPKKQEHFRA
ncbi:MAG: hypothetical protein E4H14_14945 [Candidatus Thorarchaeota archaeon]|nr:MAG: hypothetical protein E4H14_14945 [Candidatus Thorarchaeota archaeon]